MLLCNAVSTDLPASYDQCTHALRISAPGPRRRAAWWRGGVAVALLGGLLLAGLAHPARAQGLTQGLTRQEAYRRAAALTDLGRRLFFDPILSANGRQACATCHDPAHDFGPPDALPVQPGGLDGRAQGTRAVPSLKYLQAVPPFTEHFFESEDEGDESVDNGPTGGLTWDGRVDERGVQALIPLLSPVEMANPDTASLTTRLAASPYAPALRQAYGLPQGGNKDDDGAALLRAVLAALDAYQQDADTFYPYTSKYDAYLAGRATLSAAEARGLALFNDPAKGNCAACHISRRGNDGSPPQFSDFGMIAVGVPRNPHIPANADPRYFDLGLCGPVRRDLTDRTEYCGRFRTPGLRNVARRRVFMHNGVFHSLEQVMDFYADRDIHPERWYPRHQGRVDKYDDLPAAYRANVNTEPPFDRQPGDRPALSRAERRDVIAFLRILSDGWRHPTSDGRNGAAP